MTFQHERNAFTDAAAMTLQHVLDRLDSIEVSKPRERGEIASAIHSLARWLHRVPSEIPASRDYLRRAFGHLNFGTLGITRARFRNVQSLLNKGLLLAGVEAKGHTYLAPFNTAWTEIRTRIENRYARDCLARFMRFCSAQGIAPEQVDDEVVATFHAALIKEAMTREPDIAVQTAIRNWNRLINTVPEWPQRRLTLLIRRKTYSLQWSQPLPSLVIEVEQYLSILSGADPTHPLSPPRPLRPRSIRKRRYELLQLISAMHHKGIPLEDLHGLADLCRIDRVRPGLTFFIERHRGRHGEDADVSYSTMIGGIADAIRIVAKHYVQAPEDVVFELSRIAGRLNRRRPGMSEKNRRRLAQLDSPDVERRFLSYPRNEMAKLARKNCLSRRDAVRYSVLLAIEILMLAPMRSENLAALDLEQHFVWPPNGKGEIGIVIPRANVKNAVPLDYKIPVASVAAFSTYIERFRPRLLSASTTALFPGRRGQTKCTDTLSGQITDLIKNELGIEWNPHVFRHLAARLYLRKFPGDYEGARRLLAHLDSDTTYRIYEGMEMRPAVDRYDDLIETMRSSPTFKAANRRKRRHPGDEEV